MSRIFFAKIFEISCGGGEVTSHLGGNSKEEGVQSSEGSTGSFYKPAKEIDRLLLFNITQRVCHTLSLLFWWADLSLYCYVATDHV
jgi:hypothetical protein